MNYTVDIIRREEQSTGAWSGGTTTQLAIYPENSDYKARNFIWRLSTARVDVEESTFTSLPGIMRHIMIIEGEMRLLHEGHYSVLLRPFEQDSFSGGWTTKSIGCARDFNLMLSKGCKGGLEALPTDGGELVQVAGRRPDNENINMTDAFYCASGSVKVIINKEKAYDLRKGDIMLVNRQKGCEGHTPEYVLQSREAAVTVHSWISY